MKRILSLLILIVFVICISGCSSSEEDYKKEVVNERANVEETSYKETVGSYLLFQTSEKDEYLSFLTNFNESKYEIVNISTLVHESTFSYTDDYYMVTYKVIAE